ncbi:MAG: GGDEF domain-containing phosphodiesterase, partial [Lachnospiraceae bacterium]|nr:GGDEF domain-containing phosphodiesterase [Lachnospiraceae bacterium]
EYGNMILRKTAECIEHVLRPGQKLYRVVADEFAVLDFTPCDRENAVVLYNDIRGEIQRFIEGSCYDSFFTISAGTLDFKDLEKPSYSNIMKLSEFALNEAKNGEKNKIYLFEPEDYERFQRKRALLKRLRKAVNEDCKGFTANFQPIVHIEQQSVFSAETLLRFDTEETGPVPPTEFIPLLEESGLIIPVGRFVMHKAMEACSRIQKFIPDFRISVNVSYVQVLKSDVLKELVEGERRYGLRPGSVIVELTESGFLESDEKFIGFCDGLQQHGIPLALDDFGTGYSNFHYLYNVKPSTIKIDRSFTMKALQNAYEYNLLRHMVDMTHSIALKLCIEGIETQEELNRIREMNPDYIQGYFFGKPCDFDSFWREYVTQDEGIIDES